MADRGPAVKGLWQQALEFSLSCYPVQVDGIQCNVSEAEDIADLGHFAREQLGTVHLWINNAGSVTRKKMLADVDPTDISAAVGEDRGCNADACWRHLTSTVS